MKLSVQVLRDYRGPFFALGLTAAACCLAWLAQPSLHAAEETDGPYIRTAGGAWQANYADLKSDHTWHRRTELVAPGDTVQITRVGDRPAFNVKLRAPGYADPDIVDLPAGTPFFIMADSHGQYEIAAELLEKQGVIGPDLRWTFGRGQLVILGDVFDRGPHHTEILWLIYELEAEARAAGGAVHLVLGNHEGMEMLDDLRYTHARYLDVAKILGAPTYADCWSKDTLLGQWLRTKPAVLRLGSTLFLHGGISLETVNQGWTIPAMNRIVRAVLNGELPKTDPQAKFVFGPFGPLWYRGYFPNMPKLAQAAPSDLKTICKFYHVERIAVGHTIVPTVTTLFGGQVVALDINMELSDAGRGIAEGVFVQCGHWSRAKISGAREPLQL